MGRNATPKPKRSTSGHWRSLNGLGPDDMEIAINLNNLAAIRYRQEDYPATEKLYKRALTIKVQHLGDDHPDVAMTRNNLATLYQAQQRLPEAKIEYERALAIFRKTLDPRHPHLATCGQNYADMLLEMGVGAGRSRRALRQKPRIKRVRPI